MKNFKGKTAVVTGAASGIGFALAESFVKAGMQVVLADIEKQALDTAVNTLKKQKGKVIGVVTNAMLEDSVQALADKAIGEFGKVHILCNNAGVTASSAAAKPVWALDRKDWDWILGVNFYGVLYGIQSFIPHMLEHGEEGHIVNTASGAALLPGQGPYGISKHAILCLTETLYLDLKSRNTSIGASVLCPGIVNTNIIAAERNRPKGFEGEGEPASEELLEMGKAMLAKGKQPSEVADEVLESIQRDSLYILPNTAWDQVFKERLDHILARGGPLIVDQAAIMERNMQGEDF